MKKELADKLRAKIQSLPVWTRPIVGLTLLFIGMITMPIWIIIWVGWMFWDAIFLDEDEY